MSRNILQESVQQWICTFHWEVCRTLQWMADLREYFCSYYIFLILYYKLFFVFQRPFLLVQSSCLLMLANLLIISIYNKELKKYNMSRNILQESVQQWICTYHQEVCRTLQWMADLREYRRTVLMGMQGHLKDLTALIYFPVVQHDLAQQYRREKSRMSK